MRNYKIKTKHSKLAPKPAPKLFMSILTSLITILFLVKSLEPNLVNASPDPSANMPQVSKESTLPFESMVLVEDSSSPIIMEYSYGYDFYGKYGRQIPIFARISSNDRDFNGWLEATIPLAEKGSIYRKEVNIPAGESTDISMTIPLIGGYGQIEIRLVDQSGGIILEGTNPIKLGNYEKILYAGLLTDKPEDIEYIDNLAIKTFSFSSESFPNDNAYLDVLDIIIINDFDTSSLNNMQIGALRQWVLEGGLLVLGTGKNADKVALPIADEFKIGFTDQASEMSLSSGSLSDYINEDYIEELKVKILRIEEERNLLRSQVIERNKNLQRYDNPLIPIEEIAGYDWPSTNIDKLQVPNINKTISNLSFDQQTRLSSKRDLGKGKIVLYNLDLSSSNRFVQDATTYESIIVSSIIDNLSYNKKIQIANEVNKSSEYSSIINSMSYTDTENIPRVHNYAIIIIVYIIIIGPVTYLVLKKKDKTRLIWIVVPILAIVFTILIYLVAGRTRVDEPFVGYVETRLFRQDEIVEDELYFSLTAPYNNNYTVEIDKAYPNINLIELGGSFTSPHQHQVKINPKKYTAAVNYRQDKTVLEVNNNPAFSPVYFHNSSRHVGINPIEADIYYTGDKIEGTITNKSNDTINNAVYIGDSFVFNLGNIYGGQTVDLADVEKIHLNDKSEIYRSEITDKIFKDTENKGNRNTGNNNAGIDDALEKQSKSNINRNRDVLYHLIDSYIYSQPNKSNNNYIIGFTKDSKDGTLIKEITKEIDSYGTKAIMSKVNVNYTRDGAEFVPDISMLTSKDGSNGFHVKGDYLAGYDPSVIKEEETIIEYYFPKNEQVISLEYYALSNQDSLSDYSMPFVGEIYALNYRKREFDYIFSANVSKNEDVTLISQDDIKTYLSKDNVLTLKYKANFSHMDSMMLLPNISYWKEVE